MSYPDVAWNTDVRANAVYGIWRVNILHTSADPTDSPTLLISHLTPLSAFLPLFGQAVRVDTLVHDTSAHLNKELIGTIVTNQSTWNMINEVVVHNLVRVRGKSGTQPWILGKLTLVGCPVRLSGGGGALNQQGLFLSTDLAVSGGNDNNGNAGNKEVGDQSYQPVARTWGEIHGVWQIDTSHDTASTNANTNAGTATSTPTPLTSRFTPLKIVLSHFSQAVRINSLAPATSSHLREMLLGALVCDQDTWSVLNTFMILNVPPENLKERWRENWDRQPWVLGQLALVGYGTNSVLGPLPDTSGIADANHKAANSTPQQELHTSSVGESLSKLPGAPQRGEATDLKKRMDIPEPGLDERNSPKLADVIAIRRAQEYCRSAVDVLDRALLNAESKTQKTVAIIPAGKEELSKRLREIFMGFCFGFLFCFCVFFLGAR